MDIVIYNYHQEVRCDIKREKIPIENNNPEGVEMRNSEKALSRKAKKALSICIACIFIFIGLAGCSLIPNEEGTLAPVLRKPPEVKYETETVKKGTIEDKITVLAQFVSTKQVSQCFKDMGGYLKAVYFKAGDNVKAGDVIAELYTNDIKGQIARQQLSIEKLQSQDEYLESTTKRNLDQAEKQMIKLKDAYAVMQTEETAFSKLEMENAASGADQAEISYYNARDSYNNQKQQDDIELKIQKLQLEGMQSELERTRIVAALTGKLVFIDDVKLGDNVIANKNFAVIASTSDLQLKYSDNNISKFKSGMKIQVEIDQTMYNGIVIMTPLDAPLDASADVKSSVFMSVEKIPESVKIGDSASVSLSIQKIENTIVLPKMLVQSYKGSNYVYVLENGIRKERQVEEGLQLETEVEILAGLVEGEKVVK
jgi:membrane fusion protein, macrolide-specific efflux system